MTVVGGGTGSTPSGNYEPGVTITLNAGTRQGYAFRDWTTNVASVAISNPTSPTGATFVMPASHITMTANWTQTGYDGGGFGKVPKTSVTDISGMIVIMWASIAMMLAFSTGLFFNIKSNKKQNNTDQNQGS